jgi:kumamolisin
MTSLRRYAMLALPCLALLAPLAAHAAVDATFDNIRPPAGAKLTAMDGATPMAIILSLPMKDRAGAEAYGAAVSDPTNALYGHYLTPAEFGARFGGDAATYEYLRTWATANGLKPGDRTDARLNLSIRGTARQFGALFHTSFASFLTAHNGDGYIALSPPRMPDALNGRVIGVVGLSSGAHYAPLARVLAGPRRTADVGTGFDNSGYSPSDFRTAYDVPAQKSAAQTEVVGIFEQAGYKSGEVTYFENAYKLPDTPIVQVGVDGSSTHPNVLVDLEVALDIETVIGQNPDISQIIVYSSTDSDFSTALIEAFNTMGQANVAKVINISYGTDESIQGASAVQAEGAALVQLQTQGQSVFVSSGDDGAAGRTGSGLNAPDPGSQPLVTGVGGTTLNTVSAGGAWASETAWSGSGGGVSDVWAIPTYQIINGKSVAVKNGGSSTMRNVPDVAADADPNTGASVFCHSGYGGWVMVGGTSLAAPLWTAWASIINADRVAAGLPRVGFLNPLLYPNGGKEGLIGLHDITSGSNGSPGYNAGSGYDNVTGFGSVDVGKIIPFIL